MYYAVIAFRRRLINKLFSVYHPLLVGLATWINRKELFSFGDIMKVCSKCGIEKELDEFNRCSAKKDGLHSYCRECNKSACSEYCRSRPITENTKLRQREASKRYRNNHKVEVSKYNHEYKKSNRESISTYNRRYAAANPRDKVEESVKGKKYYLKNIESIKFRVKSYAAAGAVSSMATYKKLPPSDKPINDGELLTVACYYCGCRMVPTNSQVNSRLAAYVGRTPTSGVQNNFYCSDKCKSNCGTFKKQKYPSGFKANPRELQGPWAKAVKERDGHECQRCGSKENLHAHHIEAVVKEYDAWHIDNGITACSECHYQFFHQLDGCSLSELRGAC